MDFIFVLPLFFFLSVWFGINFYIGKRLFQTLKYILPKVNGKIFVLFYTILAMPLLFAFMPSVPFDLVYSLYFLAMGGFGLFVFVAVLLSLVGLFVIFNKDKSITEETKRKAHKKLAPHLAKKAFIIMASLFILPITIELISMMPNDIIYFMRVFGAYWLSFFIYLLALIIFVDFVIFVGRKLKLISVEILRKARFYAMSAVLVLNCIIVGYGLYNFTQIRVAIYEVQLLRPLAGEPMTIVFLSDLHLGEVHSERRLGRIVDEINSLNPDIVTLIGDIFNDDFYIIRNPGRAAEILRGIDSTFGVFACLGNHDAGSTVGSMMGFLEYSDITLLNEEHVIIDERLVLIGRLDPYPLGGFGDMRRGDLSIILDAVHADKRSSNLYNLPIVVIDHNPSNIPEYGSEIDLALFGHTHRGQLFPGSLITSAIHILDHGHLQKNETSPHFIVTQGIHTWLMPMRVGTNNEIGKVAVR